MSRCAIVGLTTFRERSALTPVITLPRPSAIVEGVFGPLGRRNVLGALGRSVLGLLAVGQPKMGIEMGIKMAIFSAIVWGVMMDPVIV
eukprot:scaffold8262_cov76-Skeletonema_marinoi.AAC.4